ncbi:MAG: DUF885 domain-containing protein [Acidobacteriota bacterium]
MRKSLALLTVILFAFMSGIPVYSQSGEDEKFKKNLESYLDALWKFYPTSATLNGYHNYDNKLEDFSRKNVEKQYDTLNKFNQQFVAKVDQGNLSPETLIDYKMIIDALDYEVLKHENLLPWEYNPLLYNKIFTHCIRSLLVGDFAPVDTRAKNAYGRLKNLPKLIKQAKDNLKTPPEIHTEAALKQFPAILEIYKNEIPALIEETPAAYKGRLQAELAKVVPELESYHDFLKNELLPRSAGNFRLQHAHRLLLRVILQNNLTLEELVERAKTDYNNIRREMFLVSIPFFKIMDPPFNIEKPPSNLTEEMLKNTAISHVLNHIKGDHVEKDHFVEAIKQTADRIKEFISEEELIDIPEEFPSIEPMPEAMRTLNWTDLVKPGAYENQGNYIVQVAPIDEDLSEESLTSLLEEYNNYFLPFYTAREVYPGLFVPLQLSLQEATLVQKLYPNRPLLKGWSIFVEEMLMLSGYGNYDLRLRLNQLKFQLKAVIDFLLAFNIHEGGMTKEQAIAYMTRGGFQTDAEAERNWTKICLFPEDATLAYVGYQELLDLEKELKRIRGNSFSRKDFLKEVLSFGPIHLRELKERLLKQ